MIEWMKSRGRVALLPALVLAAATVLVTAHPRPAATQGAPKVKALFEKYDLLGTFAADCSSPVDGRNVYHVYRAIDDGHVQADQMSGPTTRDSALIVDRAVESKPNELTLEGAADGQRHKVVMRMEEGRKRVVEISGAKLIADGRAKDGGGVPWFHKCTQKITLQAVPDAGGKCIDVPDAKFVPGTALLTWDCGGHSAQTFSYDESGRVTIGGLCVDAGEGKRGDAVRLAWCNGRPSQVWKADGDPSQARLMGINGLCVDIAGFQKERGAAVKLWTCHGDANQKWQIRPGFDLTYEEGANYDGNTIEELDTPNEDAKRCQVRCIANAQCAAWVYRKAEGRNNGQPHCWLRNNIDGRQRGGSDGLTFAGRVRSEAR